MQRRLDFALILFVAFIVSACGMGYELLIVRLLSTISADAVLSQSLTVGLFLLSLGIGAFAYTKLKPSRLWSFITLVEIGIAILALIALPLITMLSVYILKTNRLIAYAQVMTVLIGSFSGLELPALMELARPYSKRAFGSVLTANYLGSLAISILIPMVLIPSFGVYLTCWLLALMSGFIAAVAYIRTAEFKLQPRVLALVAVIALPQWMARQEADFEQFYLKCYYYIAPTSLSPEEVRTTIRAQSLLPKVTRFSTPYQDIDLVRDALQFFGSRQSTGFHLFIDERNQFGSDVEKIYHDTIVHGSINIARQIPEKVLVIGGGDGLLSRELLKYPEIKSITQIELDPQMIEIADHYKSLHDLNGGSLHNPRVHLEIADGFSWLRQSREKFDAIFIDLPHPISVDLSRLYSVEFYRFVHARLSPDGFMVFDFPLDGLMKTASVQPDNPDRLRAVLAAVRDAGFPTYQGFGSWESFLIATPKPRPLEFNYDALNDKIVAISAFNMTIVKLPPLPKETRPNSIFKPITLKIRVDGAS